MLNFDYHNVKIGKAKDTDQIMVTGEISNFSDNSYNTVAVRVILFVQNIIISNTVFSVNGLTSGSTKAFELTVEDLQYSRIGKDITRYEIHTESYF